MYIYIMFYVACSYMYYAYVCAGARARTCVLCVSIIIYAIYNMYKIRLNNINLRDGQDKHRPSGVHRRQLCLFVWHCPLTRRKSNFLTEIPFFHVFFRFFFFFNIHVSSIYTKKSIRRSFSSPLDANYHLLRDARISLHEKKQIFLF